MERRAQALHVIILQKSFVFISRAFTETYCMSQSGEVLAHMLAKRKYF